MSIRQTRSWALCGSVVAAAVCASPASASLVIVGNPAASTEGLGSFTGLVSYVPGSTGLLSVSLTNTTSPLIGGLITGFVFNINSADPAAVVQLVSGTHPMDGLTSPGAPPFGTFDAGAALGGSFTGGGNPNAGIAVGQTGTFVFSLASNDAQTLSTATLFGGSGGYDFVVRFRGMNDGGSDKVPGLVQIPAPAAAWLLGAAGIVGLGRRRRYKA